MISRPICILSATLAVSASLVSAGVKNVILMISDGQGYNTVAAADDYAGAPAPYQAFPVKYGMTTYSASNNAVTNPLGYDPARAWSDFSYVKSNATDSASAATAMYTGVKNYDGQVNVATDGRKLRTFFQDAEDLGKATGAVSSVNFSHATPAAVGAHNASRNSYDQIAREMIYQSGLEVIMGPGHPGYNDNAAPVALNTFSVGGDAAWADITDADGANGFAFVDRRADFEAIATGAMPAPAKLLGIPRVRSTLQQGRSGGNAQQVLTGSYNDVPTLATMTSAALNVLAQDSDGFVVMIEGGAVDWANHANQKGRMIEEQLDFNASVQAVIDWVAADPAADWSNTLLIVTADHECGHLWGPTSGTYDLDPVTGQPRNGVADGGAGVVPGMAFNSGSHTNALVPLYAIGAGSELFANYATGTDPVRGAYVDNTDVYRVVSSMIPEPTLLSAVGLLTLAGLRRRRA